VVATQGPHKAAAQVDRRLITDAQVHLWKAETPDWKWVPGLPPQLPEPFTIERLVPMMDEAGVDRAVIVPPSWPGDRNDYALEAVKRYPNRFRIMGRIPLQDPKSADLLPRWKEQQGMVGMRVTFNNAQNTPWLTDGTANWFWAAAEKASADPTASATTAVVQRIMYFLGPAVLLLDQGSVYREVDYRRLPIIVLDQHYIRQGMAVLHLGPYAHGQVAGVVVLGFFDGLPDLTRRAE